VEPVILDERVDHPDGRLMSGPSYVGVTRELILRLASSGKWLRLPLYDATTYDNACIIGGISVVTLEQPVGNVVFQFSCVDAKGNHFWGNVYRTGSPAAPLGVLTTFSLKPFTA